MSFAPMSETTRDRPAIHQGRDRPARKKSSVVRTPRLTHRPSAVMPRRYAATMTMSSVWSWTVDTREMILGAPSGAA